MTVPQTDRGYTSLLHHLHRPSIAILTQLDGLQTSITYYLAYGQKDQPHGQTPTPLAAAIVGSSMFRFPDQTNVEIINGRLGMLLKAFRHAVHYKVHALMGKPDPANPSASTSESKLSIWTRDILNGLEGGQSLVRFACLGGLLMGLEDLERQKAARKAGNMADTDEKREVDETVAVGRRTRGKVEEEVIVALAEVMETHPLPSSNKSANDSGPRSDWESEFTQSVSGTTGRILPFVAEDRLRALPLEIFLKSLLDTISSAFRDGKIFQSFPESASTETIGVSLGSKLAQDLTAATSSPQYRSVKSLAELFARVVWSFVTAKSQRLWPVLNETLLVFEEIARNLQDDWRHNPWVDVQAEEEIPESARETLTQAWGVLKTILFANVMVQQSIITAAIYLPPPLSKTTSSLESDVTPASLAWVLLRTLSNLSFVITKFGGVTSTARASIFPQLRWLFYSALDVLSTNQAASEKFVVRLCQTGKPTTTSLTSSKVMENAKMAFSLACIEQLAPNVGEGRVQSQIFDMCMPNLWDHENREVYESSHSVVLALLAAHAQRVGDGSGTVPTVEMSPSTNLKRKERGRSNAVARPLAERIVPFYTNCLLENSVEGRLISAQLRIAFAALVRSAGSCGTVDGDALVWFCIQSLLDVLSTLSPHATSSPNSIVQGDVERAHRLRLMLVSSLPTIPLKLLPRGLEAIRKSIADERDMGRREELVGEVLKEILERVGDREKVIVMKWWQSNRDSFSS
ncbi:hypothetical protein BDM02DRAFT_3095428 [Thelephora ganbajun]|uniref:Uncharacterized protein n=1 Tax=Thelephora ganbajun TaxID=370292 RepID=A0ACB6ZGV6_THEGA|nr:hypothetical protein BDM02DRAFT_3095428 [Thelephora ganbajun]